MKLAVAICTLLAVPLLAAPRDLPPGLIIPDAARPGPHFDAGRATAAYMAVLSDEQRARSDAYYEGGYWLQLWELVVLFAITALLLGTGLSRRMRELAQRCSANPFVVTLIYVALSVVVMFVLGLPLNIYSGYVREHQYGLSNQTLGAWLAESFTQFGLEIVAMPLLLGGIYAAIRRTGERWWIWASAILIIAVVFVSTIAPVAIAPLFNTYEPLPPGKVRDEVLSLARANRIPVRDVYVVDESRQTSRISANVQGLFGTTRRVGRRARALGLDRGPHGSRRPPALAMLLLAVFVNLLSPLLASIVRQTESEADAFAINASAEPHAFATAALRLATYRKLQPGPIEEALFYDHPSGYDRVHRAMTWLGESDR